MVTVVAHSYFKEGDLGAVLDLYRELVSQTRREPGCERYELFQAQGHPHHLTMLETWKDESSLQAHLANPDFLHLAAQLRPYAESATDLRVYSQVL